MPPKKMEAKVAALESEVASIKDAINAIHLKVDANQEKLIALLTQGAENVTGEISTSKITTEGVTGKSVVSGLKRIQGDVLEEFRQSIKKVELPLFNGDDPAGWIATAEVYFQVQETSPEVKVRLAQVCMEGHTIHFFKSLLDENVELTWDQLKLELMERYGGIGEGDVFEQLVSLQQGGSVEEYIQDFERLISQVSRLPDDQYFGYFIHGLKEGIRGRVRSMRALGPLSCSRLLNVARAVEYELQEKRGSVTRSSGVRSHFRSGSNYDPTHTIHLAQTQRADPITATGPWFVGERKVVQEGITGPGQRSERGGYPVTRGCATYLIRNCLTGVKRDCVLSAGVRSIRATINVPIATSSSW